VLSRVVLASNRRYVQNSEAARSTSKHATPFNSAWDGRDEWKRRLSENAQC
jgi:hypothetical protein